MAQTITDQIKKAYAAGIEFVDTSMGRMTIEEYYQIKLNPKLIGFVLKENENG